MRMCGTAHLVLHVLRDHNVSEHKLKYGDPIVRRCIYICRCIRIVSHHPMFDIKNVMGAKILILLIFLVYLGKYFFTDITILLNTFLYSDGFKYVTLKTYIA